METDPNQEERPLRHFAVSDRNSLAQRVLRERLEEVLVKCEQSTSLSRVASMADVAELRWLFTVFSKSVDADENAGVIHGRDGDVLKRAQEFLAGLGQFPLFDQNRRSSHSFL